VVTPKVLIFDFDGTIADSFEATLRIANGLAGEFGYRPVRIDEIETLRRWPYRKVASHLGVAWHKLPLIAARVRSELSRQIAQLEPIAGLPHVLAELHARGFTLGILTSNARINVERFLAAHGLRDFEFISASSSLWGKERRLKTVLKRRGLAAHEIAYIGDEVRDIEATRALAVRMIAVGWGYTDIAQLAAERPEHVIERPEELLELFSTR
jgi:phosphoglycolate phosphatase-like HAD superfamily hydrolase